MTDTIDLGNASPREIVRIYNEVLWNELRTDLVEKICANPVVRHDPNHQRTELSHQEQVDRVLSMAEKRPFFELKILSSDGTFVTIVWEMTCRNADDKICGIEVFKVTDGKITDMWNSGYYPGRWG